MKLWLVLDYERWGCSRNVIRAASAEEAAEMVGLGGLPRQSSMSEVVELVADGPPAVLWTEDESPDSPRED